MKLALTIATVLMVALPGIWPCAAAEPADVPQRPLRFLPGEGAIKWEVPKPVLNDPDTIRPTCAVSLGIHVPWDNLAVQDILQKPDVYGGLSEQQQAFLKQDWPLVQYHNPANRSERGQMVFYSNVVLFAVSEDDARKEALALLADMENRRQAEVQRWQKSLADKVVTLAEAQQKTADINAQLPKVREQCDKIEAELGYEPSQAELRQSLLEARSQLQALTVEFKGQRAKMLRIQVELDHELTRAQRSPTSQPAAADGLTLPASRELLTTLKAMLVQMIIDMAGNEARQGALASQIAEDKHYLDLLKQRLHLRQELDEQTRKQQSLQAEIESARKTLANPRAEMLPVKVLDNVAYIVPVQLPTPATQPAR